MASYKRVHEIMEFVDSTRLPDGHLLLALHKRDWSGTPYFAKVGKIGAVGEWEGLGVTEDEAIQAALNEARKADNV